MSDGYINGMGPGIQIVHHDADGMPTSISIVVEPCANEPAETEALRATSEQHVPWVHGIACYVFDDGATLLCKACGSARMAEAARLKRLSRLSPKHREWLASQGIHDWPVSASRAS